MAELLKKLPRWLLYVIAGYFFFAVTYALFDNRHIDFWPPAIHPKADSSMKLGSDLYKPWVSYHLQETEWTISACQARLPEMLAGVQAERAKAPIFSYGGITWFGQLKENSIWVACVPIAKSTALLMGASGPDLESTKFSVELLKGYANTIK